MLRLFALVFSILVFRIDRGEAKRRVNPFAGGPFPHQRIAFGVSRYAKSRQRRETESPCRGQYAVVAANARRQVPRSRKALDRGEWRWAHDRLKFVVRRFVDRRRGFGWLR